MSQHSLFIVPVQYQVWFDEQAARLGNGGPALVPRLSADGNQPATHAWCAASLSAPTEELVTALMASNQDKHVDWTRYDLATEPNRPATRLAQLGLQVIPAN